MFDLLDITTSPYIPTHQLLQKSITQSSEGKVFINIHISHSNISASHQALQYFDYLLQTAPNPDDAR